MLNTVPSAARVLDLLEFLAGSERGASLSAATNALGIAKSSTLMLLRTLVARGYVIRNDDDLYVVNDAFRQHGFGWGGSRFARLVAVALPVMEDLCEDVEETILLGALAEDGRIRLLAKMVAAQNISYDIDITTRVPAYCTAMGRVLLASVPLERRSAILESTERTKITPDTVTDLARLHRLIGQAAALGYAISQEEYAVGGTGVAAPVVDSEGRIVAALNVGCVTSRFNAKREIVISQLVKVTQNLSHLYSQPAVAAPRR